MSSNREIIEKAVQDNPGISFRGLKEKTGLSNGVLQHHLRRSEKIVKQKGALVEKDGCDECLFNGNCNDKCLKKVLRKPVERKILKMKEEDYSHCDIASELDIDPSTVSYHVNKLEELGLLDSKEALEFAERRAKV